MSSELKEAIELIEKEKGISKEVMLETIENSLLTACKDEFKSTDNIKINFDTVTASFRVFRTAVPRIPTCVFLYAHLLVPTLKLYESRCISLLLIPALLHIIRLQPFSCAVNSMFGQICLFIPLILCFQR